MRREYQNNILNKIKLNLFYIFKSATFSIFFLILFIFSLLNITGEYANLKDRYDSLTRDIGEEKLVVQIDQSSKEFNSETFEVYSEIYEQYQNISSERSLERSISTTGYTMTTFLLLVFAVICISNDYHYRTINIFANKKWGIDLISKGVATFISALVMFISCSLVLFTMNIALDKIYMNGIPIIKEVVVNNDYNVFLSLGAILLSFMYLISFVLIIVTVLKNRQYSLIAVLLYIAIPILGYMDPRSFSSALNYSIASGFKVEIYIYAIVLVLSIIYCGIAYVIANKANKYID